MVTRDAVDVDLECLMPEEAGPRRSFSVVGRWWSSSSDFLRGSQEKAIWKKVMGYNKREILFWW